MQQVVLKACENRQGYVNGYIDTVRIEDSRKNSASGMLHFCYHVGEDTYYSAGSRRPNITPLGLTCPGSMFFRGSCLVIVGHFLQAVGGAAVVGADRPSKIRCRSDQPGARKGYPNFYAKPCT